MPRMLAHPRAVSKWTLNSLAQPYYKALQEELQMEYVPDNYDRWCIWDAEHGGEGNAGDAEAEDRN